MSVRVTFLREEEAGPNYYGAIVVFENGTCAQYAFGIRLPHRPLTFCKGWPAWTRMGTCGLGARQLTAINSIERE